MESWGIRTRGGDLAKASFQIETLNKWLKRIGLGGLVISVLVSFQNCGGGTNMTSYDANNGTTSPSTSGGVTNGIAPLAPNQVNLTALSATTMKVTWVDNSDNESGFRIERAVEIVLPAVTGPGTFVPVATVAANLTSYTDTGLTGSTIYYYRVVAVNGTLLSPPSSQVSKLTPAAPASPPSSPSGLAASAVSATMIDLSWTDNSNNEDYFQVERSSDGGKTFINAGLTAVNATSYRDIDLEVGTAYVYRVAARNTAGLSSYTATATATTSAATAADMAKFSFINTNILQPNCVYCHGGAGGTARGISYASYGATLGTVSSGNPAASALYTALSRNMPPDNTLTAAQKKAISDWITNGAQNN